MHLPGKASTALAPLFFACMLSFALTANAELYCWKDNQGQTVCGDAAPAAPYSNGDRKVLNDQGQTIKVLPHVKTEAELAADADARRAQQAQQDQARYDKYLLSTFENVGDLQKSRDDRLSSLDGNIHINEMSLQNEQGALDNLNARADQFQSKGKPVPPDLTQKIQKSQNELAVEQKGLDERKAERRALAAKFDRDIARYQALKAGTAAGN
jgi:hypothetical protein